MSIRDQLARLVELQVAELDLRKLEARLAAFPREREKLDAEVEAARAAVKQGETDREESGKRRRTLEGELQTAEARVDKYQEQELQVRTNEQLWAIQAEIRGVREEIGRVETKILEEMERADAAASAIAAAQVRLKEVEQRVAAANADIDAREQEVMAAVAKDRAEIDELRAGVGDLLDTYDRLKAVRGGVGVAEIGPDGNCQACRVRLRPQLVVEANKLEELFQCENCRRILFSRTALDLPESLQLTFD